MLSKNNELINYINYILAMPGVIKVTYNGVDLYNDYDDKDYGEFYPLSKVIYERIKDLENREVKSITTKMVQFHHTIVSIKGE